MKKPIKLILSSALSIVIFGQLGFPALAATSQALNSSKLSSCLTKQAKIQNHNRRITNQLIKAVYQGEAATRRIRGTARRAASSPKVLADVQTRHDQLKNDINKMHFFSNLNCASPHPKADMDSFKAATKAARKNLVLYAQAVHNLKKATR